MWKKLLFGSLTGFGAAAVALAVWLTGILDGLENPTWGWRVRQMAAAGPNTPAIKLILLDQASLDWAKNENKMPWPWMRDAYSALIDFCARGGARSIAFDVLYTEPSVWGVADDEALGAAIRSNPAFVGAVFLSQKGGDATQWMEGVRSPPLRVAGLESWLQAPDRRDLVMTKASFPIPELATNMTALGGVAETPDPDGIIRRASLFHVFDGKAVPTLGFAAFLKQMAARGEVPEMKVSDRTLWIGGKRVPLDKHGKTILRYRGRSDQAYETFNAAAIIQSDVRLQSGEQPSVSPAVFSNACVFFGFSAPGLLDLRPTPISPVTPGVFVHATMLDNLLTWDSIKDASDGTVAAATLFLALLAGLLVIFCRKAWQSVVVFVVILPLPMVAGVAAYYYGVWWPVAVQELAASLAMVGAVVVNYATEGRQKAFIKQAFKHYLSPQVIERIIADPSQLQLGGERRELTIFFSDLQGFSSLSEKLDPPALTKLLNDYLSDMTDIILEEGGTLDKYEGDAIIAFWNAPLGQPDHAVRACRAALRCQRKLAERRGEFKERSGVELRMRIGVNTGDVVVGNMGSRDRFDYTVLGDAANLASRLEGANKAFGTYTMVSESTWKQASQAFVARELARLRVVGRQTPVTVYELLGLTGENVPPSVAAFRNALEAGFAGDWATAVQRLEAIPDDPAAASYARRCRALQENPAAPRWDGIWNLTEK